MIRKIEFSTLVLNGIPYIKHHLQEFSKLKIPWTWHIIEGVADLKNDTAWSVTNGGNIPKKFHTENYLSVDGTTEYINSISNHPNVKIYRRPGEMWYGKNEMVNAPMMFMEQGNDVLLFQVDIDELWTVKNIEKIIKMYNENPESNCGYYYCNYFMGDQKYVTSIDTYGTGEFHWPRTWVLRDCSYWKSHEPAELFSHDINLSKTNIISRDVTMSLGISFEHYAYALEKDVEFKQEYYGYKDAVSKWKKLQETSGEVDASLYIDWVSDWNGCIVNDWVGPKLLDKLI